MTSRSIRAATECVACRITSGGTAVAWRNHAHRLARDIYSEHYGRGGEAKPLVGNISSQLPQIFRVLPQVRRTTGAHCYCYLLSHAPHVSIFGWFRASSSRPGRASCCTANTTRRAWLTALRTLASTSAHTRCATSSRQRGRLNPRAVFLPIHASVATQVPDGDRWTQVQLPGRSALAGRRVPFQFCGCRERY